MTTMKNNFFLLAILVLHFKIGISQTNVSGGIFSNTTWNLAGSPYIAVDNIVVMGGVTLTISPGVIVKFNDTKGMEVRGNLQAIGTANDTIEFTSASSSPIKGIWSNISFWNNLTLDYVKFSYATTALVNTNFNIINIGHSRFMSNIMGLDFIGSTSSNVGYIEYSLFDNNNTAVSGVNHADYISYNFFRNNGIGLAGVYQVLISNNTFIGHTDKAINGYAANYFGNTIKNNNKGLVIKLFALSFSEIKDNIITDNQIGISARGDATSTPNTGFHNNIICNNSIYNVENTDNVSLYLQNNCWCTTDSATIANSIHDAYDNLSLGIVYFSPELTNCSTGIENLAETQSSYAFPNPFSEFTTLKFENSKNEKHNLAVYNSLGQIQLSINNITSDRIKIEKTNLKNGLYFFKLWTDSKVVSTGKLIIE